MLIKCKTLCFAGAVSLLSLPVMAAEEVKIAMKITPETYSGVAVVTMAPVESDRSS